MLGTAYQRDAARNLRLPDYGDGYGNGRQRVSQHNPYGDPVTPCTTVGSGARGLVLAAMLLLVAALAGVRAAHAQALPTATGTGMYVIVGGTFSEFEADYGKRVISGGGIYIDSNLFCRSGLETEERRMVYPH